MKKQMKSKVKTSKRSVKSSEAEQHELPNLVAVMMKVAERLEAVEKKMDLVISQTSVRREDSRPVPHNVQRPVPSQYSQMSQRQNQGSNQNQIFQQNHSRRERVLHKAVCADCHKDCEIPFKPTGERPVYCKECFAKRKTGNSQQTNVQHSRMSIHERQAKVAPKWAGKATISQIVSPPVNMSSKRKNSKTAKKSKR